MHELQKMILALLAVTGVVFGAVRFDRTSDSLALVAIKDANPTSSLCSLWVLTEPIDQWDGVGVINGRVEALDLVGYGLSSLPSDIGSLSNLTYLDLGYNELTSLPIEIVNLGNLIYLDLGKNQLTSLPEEIGNLGNLTEIKLWDNQLTSLPSAIGNLSNLTELELWGNQLTSLPAEIGNLGNLNELKIGCNQLTGLPAEIANLSKLRTLYLASNRLTNIPKETGNLQYLTTLDLSCNRLATLPVEIVSLNIEVQLKVDSNYLADKNLDTLVIQWLDKYQPDWRLTQKTVIQIITSDPYLSLSPLSIFSAGRGIRINGQVKPEALFFIFTLSGRQITSRRLIGNFINLAEPLPEGIFVWRIKEPGRTSSGRVVVK